MGRETGISKKREREEGGREGRVRWGGGWKYWVRGEESSRGERDWG